jgi:amino acid efflux transporter
MKEKKMGAWLLSGLIIGPILGSGIILLPPMIVQTTGDYALLAWVMILGLGFLFARLFGRLSLAYPGDAGAALAVEHAFGPGFRQLSALYLLSAIGVGPVVVLHTAGEFFSVWIHGDLSGSIWYGLLLWIGCILILFGHITFVSKISLVLSSAAALILVCGSWAAIPYFRKGDWIATPFEWGSFGSGLLLLFWALAGWEIIGNYSNEVRNREKTIPQAILISTLIIALVSLSVAAAAQWIDPARLHLAEKQPLLLTVVLYPLLGSAAMPLLSMITGGLCISTVLLVMGGTSRLMASQAEQGTFPQFLARRNRRNVPIAGIAALGCIHLAVFAALGMGWLHPQSLVAIANAFFIGNALLGILAAARLIRDWEIRCAAAILTVGFFLLLLQTPWWVWVWMLALAWLAWKQQGKYRAVSTNAQPGGNPSQKLTPADASHQLPDTEASFSSSTEHYSHP